MDKEEVEFLIDIIKDRLDNENINIDSIGNYESVENEERIVYNICIDLDNSGNYESEVIVIVVFGVTEIVLIKGVEYGII